MNRLILIGNGFDLAHNLKTKYEHFIDWYWEKRVDGFVGNTSNISKDPLCTFEIKDPNECWNVFAFQLPRISQRIPGKDVVREIMSNKERFNFQISTFFDNILKSYTAKGWVDIENEYYSLLKKYAFTDDSATKIATLNYELNYIQERLLEYLSIVNQEDIVVSNNIRKKIYAPIKSCDISVEASKSVKDYVKWWSERQRDAWERKLYEYGISGTNSYNYIYDVEDYKKGTYSHLDYPSLFMLPDNIMLLSFNYTKTAQAYLMDNKQNFMLNYIHGKIDTPSSVIFGYGDELDDNYKRLQDLNDNDCLQNIKTIKYQESDNYRNVLAFIESAPFQVCIMGHSCGNSDRTLLNTLFEHKNCISVKPYYYIKNDGTDNYLELIQNISRNFTDMKLMRDRVVNKTYCEPLT